MVKCIHIRDSNPGDFYCGRTSSYKKSSKLWNYSILGNMFLSGTREEQVKNYRKEMNRQMKAKSGNLYIGIKSLIRAHKQRGDINLVCFCKPLACHTDVIKEVLDKHMVSS